MKVQIPILNKAAGAYANQIFQSYYGNTYVRSFPASFHYPDTPKQQQVQSAFYNIQRVWWEVYPALAANIPRSQRHNKNVFNILSQGLYKSIMTYMERVPENIQRTWGLDKRNSVTLIITFNLITNQNHFYTIKAHIDEIRSRRRFTPNRFHILFYNCTRQQFLYAYFPYKGPYIDIRMYVGDIWPGEDLIIAYLALSDTDFLTNFYLCGL